MNLQKINQQNKLNSSTISVKNITYTEGQIPIILGGDLNVCLDKDKLGGKKEKQSKFAKEALALMDQHNLIDIMENKKSR